MRNLKKIMCVFSIIAIVSSTIPVSAKCCSDKYYRYQEPPRHERVVVKKYYTRNEYRPLVIEHRVYRNNNTGAVAGGIVAGVIIGGIIATIVD